MGQNWGPERRVAVSGRAGQGRASPALAPPAGVPETRERAVAVAAGAILRVPLLRCYSVTAVTPPSLHCYSTITLLSLHRYSAVTPPLLCCYYTITLLLLHRYSAVTPLLLHMGSAQVCANTRVPEVSWPGGRTSTLALLPCLLKSRTQHVLGVFCLFFVLGCVFALVAYLFPFLNSKFASKQENNRKTGTSCLYCLNRPSPPSGTRVSRAVTSAQGVLRALLRPLDQGAEVTRPPSHVAPGASGAVRPPARSCLGPQATPWCGHVPTPGLHVYDPPPQQQLDEVTRTRGRGARTAADSRWGPAPYGLGSGAASHRRR